MSAGLWTVQGPLALLFLYSGITKLTMPSGELTAQIPLPVFLLQLGSVLEILGGLGLLLPGILCVWTSVTTLAAIGLALLMAGTTIVVMVLGDPVSAMMPMVAGGLAVFVGYGRWEMVPHTELPHRQRQLRRLARRALVLPRSAANRWPLTAQ
ncbi:MAG: DoxX family protein [Chloroflexota bacterium]